MFLIEFRELLNQETRLASSSMAAAAAAKLFSISSLLSPRFRAFAAPRAAAAVCGVATTSAAERKRKKKATVVKEKRRTRSDREFELDEVRRFGDNTAGHIPVMLGEVVDVFDSASKTASLRSFVDCTVGAAGHSSAVSNFIPFIFTIV